MIAELAAVAGGIWGAGGLGLAVSQRHAAERYHKRWREAVAVLDRGHTYDVNLAVIALAESGGVATQLVDSEGATVAWLLLPEGVEALKDHGIVLRDELAVVDPDRDDGTGV